MLCSPALAGPRWLCAASSRAKALLRQAPDSATTPTHLRAQTGQAETIFEQAILRQGRGHIMNTLAEIQERHTAIQQLERSLLDLHQIFLDMAVLVEQQGDMLNNIEVHIKKSQDYVHQGTTALQGAKEQQRSMRKWMCIGVIVGLVIMAAIVIPVTASYV